MEQSILRACNSFCFPTDVSIQLWAEMRMPDEYISLCNNSSLIFVDKSRSVKTSASDRLSSQRVAEPFVPHTPQVEVSTQDVQSFFAGMPPLLSRKESACTAAGRNVLTIEDTSMKRSTESLHIKPWQHYSLQTSSLGSTALRTFTLLLQALPYISSRALMRSNPRHLTAQFA